MLHVIQWSFFSTGVEFERGSQLLSPLSAVLKNQSEQKLQVSRSSQRTFNLPNLSADEHLRTGDKVGQQR